MSISIRLSRRELLATMTTTGLIAAPDAGFIDAHVHVWPPKDGAQPRSFTPEELFTHSRPCGVTRIVLIQMSFFEFDNSYMLEAMQGHPGVFSGVALVNPEAERPQDAMRRLAKRGVRGFRLRQNWLESPGMTAMWKCGAEERLAMCPLLNPDALPSIDRLCRQFPDTPAVIDHLARIGADGEIRDADIRQLCGLARHKRTHVKVSAFYALGKKQYPYLDLIPLIRRVYDAFGPQRLMWATDSPFQVQNGHTYLGSLQLVRDRLDFLSREDREWLLGKTAERVFWVG